MVERAEDMGRRAFLRCLAASGATLWGMGLSGGCTRAPTRPEVLHALVLDVVLPDTQALAKESQQLERSTHAFVRAPDARELAALQRQWQRTLLSWKRAQVFRAGPVVESNALLRAMFWPARSQEVARVIAGSQAIDDVLMEDLGVDLKGLFAMECLLFDPQAEQGVILSRFQGASGSRSRDYLFALAQDINRHADNTMAGISDGREFAKGFAASAEQNLGILVNQMVSTVETITVQRLAYTVELLKNRRLSPEVVEGGPSGLSTQIAQVLLSTTERFYLGVNGMGLAAITQQASAPIHARVRQAFESARSVVGTLPAPLEAIARTDLGALERATSAARELEVALKVDLASALGVLLTFSLGDGD